MEVQVAVPPAMFGSLSQYLHATQLAHSVATNRHSLEAMELPLTVGTVRVRIAVPRPMVAGLVKDFSVRGMHHLVLTSSHDMAAKQLHPNEQVCDGIRRVCDGVP